jgi:hypothetical protein
MSRPSLDFTSLKSGMWAFYVVTNYIYQKKESQKDCRSSESASSSVRWMDWILLYKGYVHKEKCDLVQLAYSHLLDLRVACTHAY